MEGRLLPVTRAQPRSIWAVLDCHHGGVLPVCHREYIRVSHGKHQWGQLLLSCFFSSFLLFFFSSLLLTSNFYLLSFSQSPLLSLTLRCFPSLPPPFTATCSLCRSSSGAPFTTTRSPSPSSTSFPSMDMRCLCLFLSRSSASSHSSHSSGHSQWSPLPLQVPIQTLFPTNKQKEESLCDYNHLIHWVWNHCDFIVNFSHFCFVFFSFFSFLLGGFMVMSLWPVISHSNRPMSVVLCGVVLAAHLGITLLFKFLFFSYKNVQIDLGNN